jgi:hypothetical protein
VAGKTGFDILVKESGVASSSRGLVGDTVFAVIPNVQPLHTFAITLSVLMVGRTSARVTFTIRYNLNPLHRFSWGSFGSRRLTDHS